MARRITYTTEEILSLYQPYELPCDISVYGPVGSVESEKPIFTQLPADVGVQAPVARAPQRSLSDGTRQWNPQPIKDFSPINKFPEEFVSPIPTEKTQAQNEFANDEFTSVLQTKPESLNHANFAPNPQQIPMGYTQQYVQQFPQQQMPMGTQPYGFAYPPYQGYPYYIQQMVGTYYPQMQAYPQQNAFYGGNDPSTLQMPNYPPQQIPIQNLRPNAPPPQVQNQTQNQRVPVPKSVSGPQPNNNINSLIQSDPVRFQPSTTPPSNINPLPNAVFNPQPINVHDNFGFNPIKMTDSTPADDFENSENSDIDFFEPVLEPTYHPTTFQPQMPQQIITNPGNTTKTAIKVPVGIPMPQHMQSQLQDRENHFNNQNQSPSAPAQTTPNPLNNINNIKTTTKPEKPEAPVQKTPENPLNNSNTNNNNTITKTNVNLSPKVAKKVFKAKILEFTPKPLEGFRSAPGVASKGMRGEGMPRFWNGYS